MTITKNLQRLSDKSYELIIEFEVGGGSDYYDRFLKHPSWPGAASGVTVGIGYDCGYNERVKIMQDWISAGVEPNVAARLSETAGVKGQKARVLCRSLRDIAISWACAWHVFNNITLPIFIKKTLRAFPGSDQKLSADGFGALVSLVFNRGDSMIGSKRIHMRRIQDLIKREPKGPDLQRSIASQIRAMIPIWDETDVEEGMRRRRNAEARLMELGAVV